MTDDIENFRPPLPEGWEEAAKAVFDLGGIAVLNRKAHIQAMGEIERLRQHIYSLGYYIGADDTLHKLGGTIIEDLDDV